MGNVVKEPIVGEVHSRAAESRFKVVFFQASSGDCPHDYTVLYTSLGEYQ